MQNLQHNCQTQSWLTSHLPKTCALLLQQLLCMVRIKLCVTRWWTLKIFWRESNALHTFHYCVRSAWGWQSSSLVQKPWLTSADKARLIIHSANEFGSLEVPQVACPQDLGSLASLAVWNTFNIIEYQWTILRKKSHKGLQAPKPVKEMNPEVATWYILIACCGIISAHLLHHRSVWRDSKCNTDACVRSEDQRNGKWNR